MSVQAEYNFYVPYIELKNYGCVEKCVMVKSTLQALDRYPLRYVFSHVGN